ncbi:ATP-binding protein [Campylobacter canadensis]|uniref:ATP-binding protein n=1 Tax=Campylobacter canadensis TaxID=449520 RepID=A0ABS7WS23_9BACT|nr:ATP-binding protein [Campylobacter canadensis]MBZ7987558.1 ATP-binding protein [Campylobacter canadensis]MBZ7998686.1 ATP-binding protein [Campylobacter canadensis]
MKALALFSGGLDSMLSIATIVKQNIEVEALFFYTGFGPSNFELLEKRAKMAGASFSVVDITNSYLQEVLFNPKYGYGKAINPCIDCHAFMFKCALMMLKEKNASFVISGEVLGQRPMSQRSSALKSVKNLSGDENNLILRPLSAKLLEESIPESKGWVDRNKLLDFSGRSRTRQMLLAKEYGFSDYESPAGGCLLTLQAYKNKILDFNKYDSLKASDIAMLKLGRHLRLPNGAKMVISRNEEEGNKMLEAKKDTNLIEIFTNKLGAISLLSKDACKEDILLACSLALAYSKNTDIENECLFNEQKYICKAANKEEASKYFIV